jgi:hypothetical protein
MVLICSAVTCQVNKIIVSVSDVSVLDSVINFVPGIDIVILPNALYANDEGR